MTYANSLTYTLLCAPSFMRYMQAYYKVVGYLGREKIEQQFKEGNGTEWVQRNGDLETLSFSQQGDQLLWSFVFVFL